MGGDVVVRFKYLVMCLMVSVVSTVLVDSIHAESSFPGSQGPRLYIVVFKQKTDVKKPLSDARLFRLYLDKGIHFGVQQSIGDQSGMDAMKTDHQKPSHHDQPIATEAPQNPERQDKTSVLEQAPEKLNLDQEDAYETQGQTKPAQANHHEEQHSLITPESVSRVVQAFDSDGYEYGLYTYPLTTLTVSAKPLEVNMSIAKTQQSLTYLIQGTLKTWLASGRLRLEGVLSTRWPDLDGKTHYQAIEINTRVQTKQWRYIDHPEFGLLVWYEPV